MSLVAQMSTTYIGPPCEYQQSKLRAQYAPNLAKIEQKLTSGDYFKSTPTKKGFKRGRDGKPPPPDSLPLRTCGMAEATSSKQFQHGVTNIF